MNEKEESWEILSRIERVEAPFYLFGKIENRLAKTRVSPYLALTAAAALLLICFLDVIAINAKKDQKSTVYESMRIDNSNQLYHE